MRSLLPVLALYGAARLAALLLAPRFLPFSDAPVYHGLVEYTLSQALQSEPPSVIYPPAALILFLLPYSLGLLVGYNEAFAGLMLLLDLATVLLLAAACRERYPPPLLAVGVYLAVTSGLWPIFLGRYDVAVAATLAAALLCQRRQPGGSGAWVWLGIGAALKGAPVVLVPFLAVAAYRRGSWLALGRGGAALLAAAVLSSLPGLLWLGPEVMPTPFRDYGLWGVHLESLYSSALLLAGGGAAYRTATLAYEVAHPAAGLIANLIAPALQAAALGTAWSLATLGRRRLPDLALAGLAALLGLILFWKAFSPQYLFWVVPLAAAAQVSSFKYGVMAVILYVAALLTTLVFPIAYGELIEGQPMAILILAVRNLLLLLLFGLALWALRHPAEDQAPVREGIP